jgi:polar amino acid transport system substrate-binding protein
MKRALVALSLLVLAISSVAPASATADDALARIVERGELRVGTSGTQPPFSVKSKDGALIGFEVDLAALLAKAMQVELKLVEKPFGRLMDALAADDVDLVMSGMTMTPQRNLRAAFVGPYIVSGKSILTRDATIARIEEASELDASTLTVAALAGSTSQRFVERQLAEAELVLVDDYDAGVAMVLDGTADLMVADYPICALSVLRHGDQGLVTLAAPLTVEPIGVAVRPDAPLLLNLIENYLGALEALGVLAELEVKWFDDPGWLILLP